MGCCKRMANDNMEKVIRNLEYLISFGGASQQSMVMQIATEALVLIKEQKAEIERLKEKISKYAEG